MDATEQRGNEATNGRWFVLQAHDPELRHPIAEARFKVADLEILRLIVGPEADRDADLSASYELSEEELASVCNAFSVTFDATLRPVCLEAWHQSREAPYLNHAGFELPLMLEGGSRLRSSLSRSLANGSMRISPLSNYSSLKAGL